MMEPRTLRNYAAQLPHNPVVAGALREAADDLVRHRAAVAALEQAVADLCAVVDEQGAAVELLREVRSRYEPGSQGRSRSRLVADIDRVLAAVDRPHENETNNNDKAEN